MMASQRTASGCAQVKTKSYGFSQLVSPGIAMWSVKIGVATTGRRNPRKRTKERENRADDPGGENDGDEAALTGHFGRLEKNSRADHCADDDRARGPGAESADEFEPFLRRVCGQDFSGCHDFPFWAALSCCASGLMRLIIDPIEKVTL